MNEDGFRNDIKQELRRREIADGLYLRLMFYARAETEYGNYAGYTIEIVNEEGNSVLEMVDAEWKEFDWYQWAKLNKLIDFAKGEEK